MMLNISSAIEAITAQQPKEENAVWMVGEQLKDMLRKEPYLAEIVLRDLDVPEMSRTSAGSVGRLSNGDKP